MTVTPAGRLSLKTRLGVLLIVLAATAAIAFSSMAFTQSAYADELITEANCTITAPVASAHPDFAPESADPSKYTVKIFYWYCFSDEDHPTLSATSTFTVGKRYSVRIEFEPQPGYYFDNGFGEGATVFTINGEETGKVGDGIRELVFPKTTGELISAASCTITAPVPGANPDFAPVSGDSSLYTVRTFYWYLFEEPFPNVTETDTFVADKVYAARVLFEPQPGYYFDNGFDESATVFTINGESTNRSGDGIRELLFRCNAYPTGYYVVTAGALNVRSDPHIGAYRRGGLSFGDVINATETEKGWLGIDFDGKKAWVNADYVALTYSPETAIDPTEYKVTANALTVRADISTESDRIGGYKQNDTILVTGKRTDEGGDIWFVLDYENEAGAHQLGYVLAQFIDGWEAVIDVPVAHISLPDFSDDVSTYSASLESAMPVIAQGDEVVLAEDNAYVNDDGDVVVTVFPDDGNNFSTLKADGVELPAGSTYEVKSAVRNDDGSMTLTLSAKAPQKGTLTFDLGGGTLDGKTGSITIEANVGDTINLPGAPTKDGYTFKCWKGSEYAAGAEYVVEGDHAFTAEWEKNAPASGSGGSSGTAIANTGDSTGMLFGTLAFAVIVSACALTRCALRRREG